MNHDPQQDRRIAVAAKSPVVGLLASAFIPGLGSIINGATAAGIAVFIAWVTSWVLLSVAVGFVTLPAVWVVALWHGYASAGEWNAKRGITS